MRITPSSDSAGWFLASRPLVCFANRFSLGRVQMKFRTKLYCVLAAFSIMAGYLGGLVCAQTVQCEQGCKQILAKTVGGANAIVYDIPHCYTAKMWVTQAERHEYGCLKTSCVVTTPQETVRRYSCANWSEVCAGLFGSTIREVTAPLTEDCGGAGTRDRKECV